jgi:hypothetical protein
VVPFRFACTRCGHCCSGGHGCVWLAEGEIERLAAALGMQPEAFARLHVREALDPRTGERRLALLEGADGRCTLLEGRATCRAYAARPEHCRAFPYWPAVLAGGEGFEAARSTCPGIAVQVAPALAERAFAALEALHAELFPGLAPGGAAAGKEGCCLDRPEAETLFVSALEADHAAARGRPQEGCRLGAARPLGCRLAADPVRGAAARERLSALERRLGYPRAYGPARDLLRARGFLAEEGCQQGSEP